VETVGIRQVMCIVMLESGKDRILGVETLGQEVMPRIWYGMTCLLIRGVVGSVPCSDE
jgi:ABC-type dipeptide/oligopeptide/nickel transport system permease subunit